MATLPVLPSSVLTAEPPKEEEMASWHKIALTVVGVALGIIFGIPLGIILSPVIVLIMIPVAIVGGCRKGWHKLVTWYQILSYVEGEPKNIVLHLKATHDYNGAFEEERNHHIDAFTDRYLVVEHPISDVADIQRVIDDVPADQRIKILWISAHGSSTSMTLGVEKGQILTTQNAHLLQQALERLAPDADIVLDSCSTGDGKMIGLTKLVAEAVIQHRRIYDDTRTNPDIWDTFHQQTTKDLPYIARLVEDTFDDPNWLEYYQAIVDSNDMCVAETIAGLSKGRTVHAYTQPVRSSVETVVSSVDPLKLIYIPWGDGGLFAYFKLVFCSLFATELGIALASQDAFTTYRIAPDSPAPDSPLQASTQAALSSV